MRLIDSTPGHSASPRLRGIQSLNRKRFPDAYEAGSESQPHPGNLATGLRRLPLLNGERKRPLP
jgi:hypothetical protein